MRKVGIALATIVLAGALTSRCSELKAWSGRRVADKNFEAFLPPANFNVPWLSIDKRSKLPKGDFPSAGTQTLDR